MREGLPGTVSRQTARFASARAFAGRRDGTAPSVPHMSADGSGSRETAGALFRPGGAPLRWQADIAPELGEERCRKRFCRNLRRPHRWVRKASGTEPLVAPAASGIAARAQTAAGPEPTMRRRIIPLAARRRASPGILWRAVRRRGTHRSRNPNRAVCSDPRCNRCESPRG